MARIGRMDNFDIVVFTDDTGAVPHVHIIDSATRGQEFDTCIQLGANKYFLHGNRRDILTDKQCKAFNIFMNAAHSNTHYRNNYEYALNMWNDNNTGSYIQLKEDPNGNIIIPDYNTITR